MEHGLPQRQHGVAFGLQQGRHDLRGGLVLARLVLYLAQRSVGLGGGFAHAGRQQAAEFGALQQCGADPEVFVIGGEQIFRLALPYAHRLYLSTIDRDIEGDTRMPAIDASAWQLTHEELHPGDAANALPWKFQIYDRKQPPGAVP